MLSLTGIFVGLLAFAFVAYFFNNKRGYSLPPGPWGLPIFGHILFFGNNPARKFLEWKKIYGTIFTVRFGSFRAVILNDVKTIKEAFNMHEFSGRPLIPMFTEINNGLARWDGPKQAEQRIFVIKTLREFSFGSKSIEPLLEEETSKLFNSVKSKIRKLDGKPLQMNKIFQFAVINSLWISIMGKRFQENDPTLTHLLHCIEQGMDTNSSFISQLFYFFPWVAKLGNTLGYNPPVHAFQNIFKFIEKEIEKLKHVYVSGQPKNFSEAYFDKLAETTDPHSSFHKSDNQQPFSTGDLFIAAVDTTGTTLDWLMIHMAKEPEIQAKLQREIDSFIGLDKSRVPCLSDRCNMSFTKAVIEELLRVSSVGPLGFYHRAIEDVVFKGYKIPKNTIVIGNLFAVHRDPEVWQNPDKFDPSRFLDINGQFTKTEMSDIIPFSFGKRNCLGESFARDQLFLLVTNFFRDFTVSCTDNIPSLEPVFGIVMYPLPFELNVKERPH